METPIAKDRKLFGRDDYVYYQRFIELSLIGYYLLSSYEKFAPNFISRNRLGAIKPQCGRIIDLRYLEFQLRVDTLYTLRLAFREYSN